MGGNTTFSQQRLVILSLVDFKLVTLCAASSIVPLVIPPAFLAIHLLSLCSLMTGSPFLRTCSESQIREKVRAETESSTLSLYLHSQNRTPLEDLSLKK